MVLAASKLTSRECRSRVIFLTLRRGYRSRRDDLDREVIRREEGVINQTRKQNL